MKAFVSFVVFALVAAFFYGYFHNPAGCAKLVSDTEDLAGSLIFKKRTFDVDNTTPPPATPAVTAAPPPPVPAVSPAPAPTPKPQAPTSTPAPAAVSTTVANTASPTPPDTTTNAAPTTPPAPSSAPAADTTWPPSVIPSQPNWTWTTQDGRTYENVTIQKMDPAEITISHSMGVAHIDPNTLTPDIQKQLNYDPVAVAKARAQAWTTDYPAALGSAKSQGKLVLLDFTGSDWCGDCKVLEKEVLNTPEFKEFSGDTYVLVRLDFPRQIVLPQDVQQQNMALQDQFKIKEYPTLVVVDTDGKELGRIDVYHPGSGPEAVISGLKKYNKN